MSSNLNPVANTANELFDHVVANVTKYCSSSFDEIYNKTIQYVPINTDAQLQPIDITLPEYFMEPTDKHDPSHISRVYNLKNSAGLLGGGYLHIVVAPHTLDSKTGISNYAIHRICLSFGIEHDLGLLALFTGCKHNHFNVTNINDTPNVPIVKVICSNFYHNTVHNYWMWSQKMYSYDKFVSHHEVSTTGDRRLKEGFQLGGITRKSAASDIYFTKIDYFENFIVQYEADVTYTYIDFMTIKETATGNTKIYRIANVTIPHTTSTSFLNFHNIWVFKLLSETHILPNGKITTEYQSGGQITRTTDIGTQKTTDKYDHFLRKSRLVADNVGQRIYEDRYVMYMQLQERFAKKVTDAYTVTTSVNKTPPGG